MKLLNILSRIEAAIEPNYTELLLNGLHSEFIEQSINKAVFDVFLDFFKEFEKNQTIKFGISNLIKSNVELTPATSPGITAHENAIIYTADYMYYTVNSHMSVNSKFVSVKPITHDYYNKDNLDNPMKRPSSDSNFWRLDIGKLDNSNIFKEVIVDTETFSIYNSTPSSIKYYVTYIKLPDEINMVDTNSEIDMNDEIIEKFVIPLSIGFLLQKYAKQTNNTKQQ